MVSKERRFDIFGNRSKQKYWLSRYGKYNPKIMKLSAFKNATVGDMERKKNRRMINVAIFQIHRWAYPVVISYTSG